MKIDECPCIDCICLPICKTKMYAQLLICNMIKDYLYLVAGEGYQERLIMVINTFKLEPVYVYTEDDKAISQSRTFGNGYEPAI